MTRTQTYSPPAPAPRKPNPEGELVISFYDSAKELLSTETFALTKENQWETLSFATKAEEKGFVSASIRGTSSEPVKFDDFSIQLKSLYSAKLYQENHYYPFGMNMKGLENEDFQTVQNKDEHLWQYNGKERQDDFDLFWLDYGARNYDSQVGRWHSVDPLAERRIEWTVFNYCVNNPISHFDPDGRTDYAINKTTGLVTQIGETNDEPDRVVKVYQSGKRKGQVKRKKNGEARVAFGGIEKGILEDGMNFKKDDQVFNVGGEGEPSLEGVENFIVDFAEYLGVELGGVYLSHEDKESSSIAAVILDEYDGNEWDKNTLSITMAVFGDERTKGLHLHTDFHTHPSTNRNRSDVERPSGTIDGRGDIGHRNRQRDFFYRFIILFEGENYPYDAEKTDYTNW